MPPRAEDRRRRKRKPLDDAQRALAERYLPLAYALAWRFSRAYRLDLDDCRSVAFESLALAAESYRPEKGKVGGYFRCKISFGLSGWIRHLKRTRPVRSVLSLSDFRDADASFDPADPRSPTEAIDARDAAAHCLSLVSPRDRAILLAIHDEGRTDRDLAHSLGCVPSYVGALRRRAEADIRAHSSVQDLK